MRRRNDDPISGLQYVVLNKILDCMNGKVAALVSDDALCRIIKTPASSITSCIFIVILIASESLRLPSPQSLVYAYGRPSSPQAIKSSSRVKTSLQLSLNPLHRPSFATNMAWKPCPFQSQSTQVQILTKPFALCPSRIAL